MKTLEDSYRELIDDVFRSFSDEHRAHLNKMFRGKTAEWLTQKRQEMIKRFGYEDIPYCVQDNNKCILDELLEETK